MLTQLREAVWKANLDLPKHGLVTFTWGNVSGFDADKGLIVIKPSGIPYAELQQEHLVIVDLDGRVVEGTLRPSSDTATHLVLYREFPGVGGIVHTHSPWATSWAQAGRGIPALGTTHADYFYGTIPCTRTMKPEEITDRYEEQTGDVIVKTFADSNPSAMPGVLVNHHGPFSWGKDPDTAVHNAVVLEEVAKMAFYTFALAPSVSSIDQVLLDRHYLRKHGTDAYYGQDD